MGPFIYVIGALTLLSSAVLLLRGYARARQRLLLWSGLCFAGLALSNFLAFVDLALVPEVYLYNERLAIAAVALVLLLCGLIWESE